MSRVYKGGDLGEHYRNFWGKWDYAKLDERRRMLLGKWNPRHPDCKWSQ